MEIRQIDFEKLRHAYVTVKYFLENEGHQKVSSLNNKVEGDLGLYGDDNYGLLITFVTQFELDYQNFDYNKHFYSEEELFDSTAAILNLLTLSIYLPLKTIELLTLNKIKIDKPTFPITPDRKVSDLTFRDMLTWYIEKEYRLGTEIKYEIRPNTLTK
jgi:hypothetical protein